MKRETREHLSYSERGISLSKAERETLQQASVLAARIREEARLMNPDFEDDGQDTMIAQVEHNAQELANDGFVPVVEIERFES